MAKGQDGCKARGVQQTPQGMLRQPDRSVCRRVAFEKKPERA
jgi:hypothetical protein